MATLSGDPARLSPTPPPLQDPTTGSKTFYDAPQQRRRRRLAASPSASADSWSGGGYYAGVAVGGVAGQQTPAAISTAISDAFSTGTSDAVFANATRYVRARYGPASNATDVVYLLRAVEVRRAAAAAGAP